MSRSCRKTVYIPLVGCAGSELHRVLEVIVEPAPCGVTADEGFDPLRTGGLGRAVVMAQDALAQLKWQRPGRSAPRAVFGRPPMFLVVNPTPALSNSEGASFAIALGALMYDGRCPVTRAIAIGSRVSGNRTHHDAPAMSARLIKYLRALVSLGYQETVLPCFVELPRTVGAAVLRACEPSVKALHERKIEVLEVSSLEDALLKCSGLQLAC